MNLFRSIEDGTEICELGNHTSAVLGVKTVYVDGEDAIVCEECANRIRLYSEAPEGDVKISIETPEGASVFSMYVEYLWKQEYVRDCIGAQGIKYKTAENYDRSPLLFHISWKSLENKKTLKIDNVIHDVLPLENGFILRIEYCNFPG